MKGSNSKPQASENGNCEDTDWELRPGGMLVQKREDEVGSTVPLIKIKVYHDLNQHDIIAPAQSTFGELKKVLAQLTGLAPEEQRLLFRGKEKDNSEHLHMAGVKDMSKVVLLEDPGSRERKIEQRQRDQGIDKACEAVAVIRHEVDKLVEKVNALKSSVQRGTKVADQEFVVLTELLMRQLLKLDGIEAEGEAKVQRRTEVRRIQLYVEMLDALKQEARNPNPFSNETSSNTQWQTFDSAFMERVSRRYKREIGQLGVPRGQRSYRRCSQFRGYQQDMTGGSATTPSQSRDVKDSMMRKDTRIVSEDTTVLPPPRVRSREPSPVRNDRRRRLTEPSRASMGHPSNPIFLRIIAPVEMMSESSSLVDDLPKPTSPIDILFEPTLPSNLAESASHVDILTESAPPVDSLTASTSPLPAPISHVPILPQRSPKQGQIPDSVSGGMAYESEIPRRRPLATTTCHSEMLDYSVSFLRDLICRLDPHSPETLDSFVHDVNATLDFLCQLGLEETKLFFWEISCREVEFFVRQLRPILMVNARVSLPEFRERVRLQREAADLARNEYERDLETLRQHRARSAEMTEELRSMTSRIQGLWRELVDLISRKVALQQAYDRSLEVIDREQARLQLRHRVLTEAKTALTRAVDDLQTSEAEHVSLVQLGSQLRDFQRLFVDFLF